MQALNTEHRHHSSHLEVSPGTMHDESCKSIEQAEAFDEGMTFFIHYVAVCVLLVLAMAAVLEPFAVVIGVAMSAGMALAVWLITSLAEIFNEYVNVENDK